MPSDVRLSQNPFTPRCDEEGRPTTKIVPFAPVVEPCTVCPAKCCRLRVKASVVDVVAYCRVLQVPLFAGHVVRETDAHSHSFRMAFDERAEGEAATWSGFAELELRRHDDGRCHGLIDVGGFERCGVYAARPAGCRTYPIGWETEETRGGPGSIVCPVPYAIRPQDERQFVANVEEAIDRWALHDAIVAEWNASSPEGGHRLDAFLVFAMARVARALDVDTSVVLQPGGAAERLHELMMASRIVPRPDQ